MRLRRSSGQRRQRCNWFALILLVPFLALSLIKPGTMLTADAQGRMMVVLCGSDLPVEMAVAADGTLTPVSELPQDKTSHGGSSQSGAHPVCAWSQHAQPVLAGAGAAPLVPRVAVFARQSVPRPVAHHHSGRTQVPPARGPPLTQIKA